MMPVHPVRQARLAASAYIGVARWASGIMISILQMGPRGHWQGGQRRRHAGPGLGTDVAVEEHITQQPPPGAFHPDGPQGQAGPRWESAIPRALGPGAPACSLT